MPGDQPRAGAASWPRCRAGDAIELKAADGELEARVGGIKVGQVEPRVANRLVELMANGNRYEAALTHVQDEDLRLIIRETFADPSNFGKVSFPGAASGRPAVTSDRT